ncbi:MAG: hypothetical protein ABI824_18750 [Acidobacteriota bacterium]
MVTKPVFPGSSHVNVLILGCGFTGQRVAKRLLSKGVRVIGTTREPSREDFADLRRQGAEIIRIEDALQLIRDGFVPTGFAVLHSIPPSGPNLSPLFMEGRPSRVVYLSSTAVYGEATEVNEVTAVDGSTDRSRARLLAEAEIRKGPWSTLILRPAAIYGPGRGVQVSYPRGEYRVGDNYVSRIHVDDLAAHVDAALTSNLIGAFPVADEEPCTAREIATFCAQLLRLPMPDPAAVFTPSAARITGNRRVDGSAIRRLLGVSLQYPSYRSGIPASLLE